MNSPPNNEERSDYEVLSKMLMRMGGRNTCDVVMDEGNQPFFIGEEAKCLPTSNLEESEEYIPESVDSSTGDSTPTSIKKERKIKKKKKQQGTSNDDVFKNQPVVIDLDGGCSKNRTIVAGSANHKYEVGKLISFKKCNVNGHPTLFSQRPIALHGSIGAMIVNERSSRRVGQDRIPCYGVQIVPETVSCATSSTSEESTATAIPKKRKRDDRKNTTSVPPSFASSFPLPLIPSFPAMFSPLDTKNSIMAIVSKLKLVHVSPNRAHSKKSQHFVLYVSLSEQDPLLKANLITQLLSPFSPSMSLAFEDKSNSSNTYIINKKHVLTPLMQEQFSEHDLEIFSYTPVIKEHTLDCSLKLVCGGQDITNSNGEFLDFEFYNDKSLESNTNEQKQNAVPSDDFDFFDETMEDVINSAHPNSSEDGVNHQSMTSINDLDAFNLFEQYEISTLSQKEKYTTFKRDSNGHTLLHHFAVREMYKEVIDLIELGYNPYERDVLGLTARDWCKLYRLEDMEDLIEYMTSPRTCSDISFSALPPRDSSLVMRHTDNDVSPTTLESPISISEYLDLVVEDVVDTNFELETANQIMYQILKNSKSVMNSVLLNPDLNIFVTRGNNRCRVSIENDQESGIELLPRLSLKYWSPEFLLMMCMKTEVDEKLIPFIIVHQNLWTLAVLFTEFLYLSLDVTKRQRNSVFGMTVSEHLLASSHFEVLGRPDELRQLLDNLFRASETPKHSRSSNIFSSIETINAKEKERIILETNERAQLTHKTLQLGDCLNCATDSCKDMLEKILRWVPENRITIDQILEHNFWNEFETNRRSIRECAMKHKLLSQIDSNYGLHCEYSNSFSDVTIQTISM
ncbi:hypothetical protein C9374_006019 [Naegleria lovaniensis]|uniref:Protein kinase domain-containing protein n=1 Tax=Naegleria lovaniensis TaxID=51637 RepID=A0AA88KJK7_NAELO|nr:uncharacterized protein C9374_006019 [Naegleria lovaniensis]KAG2381635.1 hypothetical protein C9374_006019 [Naegleria lovaniensis]